MTKEDFTILLIKIIATLFVIALIAFYITLLVMYGNKPHDEVPTWVLWLLFRKIRWVR